MDSHFPSGTVAFLFTDMENSTKLAHEYAEAWENARARHHAILNDAVESNRGYVFQIIGDSFSMAFHTTGDALRAAIKAQAYLKNEAWIKSPIKIRMGIHTGVAHVGNMEDRSGGYIGYITLSFVQRVMSIGHGGQILISNTSAELIRNELPDQVTLQNMGKHHLKGLPNPEQIWQVNAPSLQHEFPPLNSSKVHSNNLPLQLTSFVGREKEISEVKDVIARHHLVTLIGPGGTGKTRLSLQVAQELIDQFLDGLWFVELAPILDPTLVPRTTAIAIGLRDEPQRPIIDMLCDYLHKKQLLIVLDNCEHLVDACAQMANKVLQAALNVRILASSREALGIAGEATYRVPSLGLPEFDFISVESLAEHEATRLFIDRATTVLSTFSATDDNAPAIAQVCRRLDGIPLAIELAAAKIRVLSVDQIAKRLDDRFRLLTGGSRVAMERHQTLRAAIDWGYNLLQPAEQTLFCRLSVFVDGWTLEAAESVCESETISSVTRSDVLPLLEQLINKSFVIKEESDNDARYRMLETIKQYATEKLIEANKSDLLRDQHLIYFLSLAENAAPHLIRPEQLEWLAQLDAEYQNLRAALEWALNKELPEMSMRLCNALGRFWGFRGYWREASQWISNAIVLVRRLQVQSAGEKAAYIKTLYWDAHFAQARDELEHAITSAELSLALAQAGNNKMDIAIARYYVAFIRFQSYDNQNARSLAEQSLLDFQELHDPFWESRSYDIYGRIRAGLGEIKASERILHKLELNRKAGERSNLGDALFIYAIWHYIYERMDEARKYAEEANVIWKQVGIYPNATFLVFALLAWSNGEYERAKAYYTEMCDHYRVVGEKSQRTSAISALGLLEMEQGHLSQAQTFLEEALAATRELGYKPQIMYRLTELGNLFYLLGKTVEFKQYVREGILLTSHFSAVNKSIGLAVLLDSAAIQKHASFMNLLGTIYSFEKERERQIRLHHKRFSYKQFEAHARELFGDAAFESAFAEGQKMNLDDALDLVLKTVEEM
jgi:predicted ATPase/class 3 adenylate cyclase